jgi:2-desacetyl-2-hydroxyethyl bacteriochlorophyllide A dehydrogenase
MSAHALSFQAPRRVGIAQCDLPPIGAGQTLVRTLYSGISTGTELLAYRGLIDPSLPLDESLGALHGTFEFPFRYGYSCVGTVERSDSLPPGALVFAFHPHQDRFVAPTTELIALGDADARQATLLPLVETALQVVLDAGMVTDEPVVVHGLGLVGMLTAMLLTRAGARVTAGEPRQWRRVIASSVGIDAVEPGELPDAVKRLTGGDGVALVVEASGNPDVLPAALDLLGHEGQALIASWYGTEDVRLPLGGAFHRRRLAIRSTQVSTIPSHLGDRWTIERRRATAKRLLGELPLAPLATHTFAFEDAAQAFEALDRGDEGILHVALSYGR